jgi:hypothetical protein
MMRAVGISLAAFAASCTSAPPPAAAPTTILQGQLDLPTIEGTRLCTDDEYGPTVPGDCLLIETGEYEDVIAAYSDIVTAAGFAEIARNGLRRVFARDRACAERLLIFDTSTLRHEPSKGLIFHLSCARPQ